MKTGTQLVILSALSLFITLSLAPTLVSTKGHRGGGHKYSCPVLRKCRTMSNDHGHKICGSDGQLYDSTCHLRKSGCEKGIHLKPAHPDQCIKEEDDFEDDGDDGGEKAVQDEQQNDPSSSSSFAARYQSADLSSVTPRSSNPIDANDLKEENDSNADEDDDVDDPNEKKRRIKSDGNMDEEGGEVEDDNRNENEGGKNQKQMKKGRKDQFSNPVSRSSESVSCSPTNYDLMKEQIQAKWNDISLLFSDLDENADGTININELWQKSGIYKISNSPCLITDLLLHEDKNEDDSLDFTEFQNAFSNLYTITMVTLDPSVAVSHINAHVGDNVEIRCDIVGKPQPPVIQWFRHNVNLATLNLPNLKVFADGSLYLTGVQVSFTGNYTCQAETNSAVKQTHILHVIVGPVVEVAPEFQWLREGDSASIDCRYESLIDDVNIKWFKNDREISLTDNGKTSLLYNGSRLHLSDVTRSDTGAYTCQVYHTTADDGEVSSGEDVSSLLVQDEPVVPSPRTEREKLWLFHGNGVTIYNQGCHGIIHELDSRDVIPFNGLPLCSRSSAEGAAGPRLCEWGPRAVQLGQMIYITQPNLNRIIAFHTKQLVVTQIIATDPQPRELWITRNGDEDRIWVLCHGLPMKGDNSKKHRDFESRKGRELIGSFETLDMNWNSPSREQQLHNKKTIQILRFNSKNQNEHNLIHLQPIDGHFDLVYDIFIPLHSNGFLDSVLKSSPSNNQFAYVTHWDERALVKIDMEKFKYIKKINLAECQPINAVFTFYGLVILQCQTPVTHKLNGQLILDQMTDAIISFNPHIRGSKNFLSPDHKFLITISRNESTENSGLVPSTTIIVQKVTKDGVTFMYDVRTTLNIVSCDFVWKSGNYDALLGSGTSNREDLLYLSLVDGRVELVSGVGKPTAGSRRGVSISSKSSLAAVTSLESIFVVDLTKKGVQCEAPRKHQNPSTLFWS